MKTDTASLLWKMKFIFAALVSSMIIGVMPVCANTNPRLVPPRKHAPKISRVYLPTGVSRPASPSSSSRPLFNLNSIPIALTVTATYDSAAENPSVSDTTAGGKVTLRSAVEFLDTGAALVDSIFVPAGKYVLTDTGYNENNAVTGDLDVNRSVTIAGSGAGNTIIVGDSDRVFDINPDSLAGISVTISDLTITGGRTLYGSGENGGGIEINDAAVTLDTVDVNSNRADGCGGGINISADGGTLTMNGCTLDSNIVYRTGGEESAGPGDGGGANFFAGKVTMNNVTIQYDTANGSGAGIQNNATGLGANLALNNCTVSDNAAPYGGIGGGIDEDAGTLTVTGGVISGNSAVSSSSGYGFGGGIDIDGGNVNLSDVILENNLSYYGGGVDDYGSNLVATLTASGCTFRNNVGTEGGAIYSNENNFKLSQTYLDSNYAKFGGALYVDASLSQIQPDSLDNATISTDTAGSDGGGIYFQGSLPLQIDSSTIKTGLANQGGGIYDYSGDILWNNGSLDSNVASTDGGGIYFAGTKNDTLTNVTISGNSPNGIVDTSTKYQVVLISDKSLSVQATDFVATSSAGAVTLTWVTKSEVDNAGFSILREDPGTSTFSMIAGYTTDDSLRGLGTSSTGRTYDFTDDKVISGATYTYEIQSVSTSGTTKDLSTLTVTVDVPKTYALYQNYPNPFNPTTVISYQLPAAGHVTLKVYDALGQSVATLVDKDQSAGFFRVNFDGARYASGVYFYRIEATGAQGKRFVSIEKMLLLK